MPLYIRFGRYTVSITKKSFTEMQLFYTLDILIRRVPPRMMSQLHAKCGSLRKELLQIAGGTHNDTWAVNG